MLTGIKTYFIYSGKKPFSQNQSTCDIQWVITILTHSFSQVFNYIRTEKCLWKNSQYQNVICFLPHFIERYLFSVKQENSGLLGIQWTSVFPNALHQFIRQTSDECLLYIRQRILRTEGSMGKQAPKQALIYQTTQNQGPSFISDT